MSWKDHPIVIATGTCVATLGVCYNLLVPVYTSTLENQIAKNSNTINELKEALDKAQSQAERLNHLNKDLLSDRAFSSCNPYPRAFNEVKVGDPSSRVFDVYGKDSVTIEEKNKWLTVKNSDDPIFGNIVYYVDKATSKIYQILFFYKERVDIPPLKLTHDPKKESATQLAIIKQLRDSTPQITMKLDEESSELKYNGIINGKEIIEIDQNTLLITYNASTLSNKNCDTKK